ncbi:MAG: site-specific DNA-methyltransferase [Yonghaparkia sp.]|nr:site-specific DNA-methyltransferase [Microcella sp.]
MAVTRFQPGQVRDAIFSFLSTRGIDGASLADIELWFELQFGGPAPSSSIRSYLQANTPGDFERLSRGKYRLSLEEPSGDVEFLPVVGSNEPFEFGRAKLFHGDSLEWLDSQPKNSIHGVVTDPPYGLVEYTPLEQAKLRAGRGGNWRLPPSFDGHTRSPLPRFTTLSSTELEELGRFFGLLGKRLLPVLVPGAHVLVAANPLLSHLVAYALDSAGLERRGEVVRLVSTMRGGDRPKNAHDEFPDVSVMPRSQWEPWLLFRKPIEGTVAQNLRRYGTGGLRRISDEQPFGDVIRSSPTQARERLIANHPSLKPQAFLRQVVRAILPMGEGIVLDPFAGSGSTLAAAEAVGYRSVGVEMDEQYFDLAKRAIPSLVKVPDRPSTVEVDPAASQLVDPIAIEG